MVERPIKKSERQQVAPPDAVAEGLETSTFEGDETSTPAPKKGKIALPTRRQDQPEGDGEGRSEGRGKGRSEGRGDGRGDGRSEGRGDGRKQREEGRDRPGGTNMALMRGPKPSKAKPPVVVAQEAEPEAGEAATDAEQVAVESEVTVEAQVAVES